MRHKESSAPTDLSDLLKELPRWLDGVSQFIRISNSQWSRSTTLDHLLAQSLAKDTLRLKAMIQSHLKNDTDQGDR